MIWRQLLTNKYLLRYLMPISILIAFHLPIEEFLTSILVRPFLSHIDALLINDIIFYAFCVYMLSLTLSRITDFVPSRHSFFILLLISICYLYYREAGLIWKFESLKTFPGIFYADLILICAGLNGTLMLLALLKREEEKPQSDGLKEDLSLGEEATDQLGFGPYVLNLVEEIMSIKPKASFAIGVNGKWGSGKTSFFDLLKRELNDKDLIIINFDPWNSHSPKAIIKDFFDSIEKELRPYHSQLPKLINTYSDKLVSLHSEGWMKLFKEVKNIIAPAESLNGLYEDINKAIKAIDKKILIFIDDIDRLDAEEIAEVIRLIRNTANFRNTFFIAAYDRAYLLHAIKTINPYNYNHFLEKIFQLEINLPHFDKIKLQTQLVAEMKIRFPEKHHLRIENEVLGTKSSKPNYFEGWVETLRDVTRLSNGLTLNLSRIIQEVELSEYIRLEILRQKFPAVYELIYKRTEYFLHSVPTDGYVLKPDGKTKPTPHGAKPNSVFEHYLLENHTSLAVQENEIPKIIDLLDGLFGKDEIIPRFKSTLSVVRPNRFKLYFSYYFLDSLLSEEAFNNARAGELTAFYKQLDDWFANDLSFEAYDRLTQIRLFKSSEDFEKVIQAIFYLARKTPAKIEDQQGDRVYGFDDKNLKDKLGDYENTISKRFYNGNTEQYAAFLRKIFSSAKSPYIFDIQFLKFINNEFEFPFPLQLDERLTLIEGYFGNYVEGMTSWSDTVWTLYHSCKYTEWIPASGNSYIPKEHYTDNARDIMIKAVKTDIQTFLSRVIALYPLSDNELYTISTAVVGIWGSWEAFANFVGEQEEVPKDFIDEFHLFYQSFSLNNFTTAVKFEFKIIPVSKKSAQH